MLPGSNGKSRVFKKDIHADFLSWIQSSRSSAVSWKDQSKLRTLSVDGTEKILNKVFRIIADRLVDGSQVQITGFGTFRLVERGPIKVPDTTTGTIRVVPAKRVVKFTPSTHLARAVERVGKMGK